MTLTKYILSTYLELSNSRAHTFSMRSDLQMDTLGVHSGSITIDLFCTIAEL